MVSLILASNEFWWIPFIGRAVLSIGAAVATLLLLPLARALYSRRTVDATDNSISAAEVIIIVLIVMFAGFVGFQVWDALS